MTEGNQPAEGGVQSMDILHAIGNTSIVRLRKVVPPNCADIFVKLEWENPTGSMKDRLAREEALFAGTSSGANVVAAIQVADLVS
jgi:cysteine synthase